MTQITQTNFRKTTIFLIALSTALVFWLLTYDAGPRRASTIDPEVLIICDVLISVLVAAIVSTLWEDKSGPRITASSGHLLATYWTSLAGGLAALAGGLAIAITTTTAQLTSHTLPAWRPAGSFALMGLALASLAISLRAERRYSELKRGPILASAISLSKDLQCSEIDSSSARAPGAEPGKSLSAYVMGSCTESECRLCRTALYARTPDMQHSGISAYQ